MQNSIKIGQALLPVALGLVTSMSLAEPVDLLDTITITATRSGQHQTKTAAKVSVISASDIAKSSADTVPDLLRNLPGVHISDLAGNGNNQTIDIGGFGETANRHVAIVVDGRRINPIDMGNISWSTIPIENIERIEVLHGSGSVLYGDNAMGGVVNIITKNATKQGTKGSTDLSIGSFDSHKLLAEMSHAQDNFGIRTGVTQSQTDGYRDRSNSEKESFFSHLWLDASESTSLSAEINISQADYELPGPLTQLQVDSNRRQAINQNNEGETEERILVFGLDHNFTDQSILRVELHQREVERDSEMASWFSYMTFDIDTTGFTPQYILESPIAGLQNRLILGVDYYNVDYSSWRSATKGAKTNRYKFTKETLSGYLQDELQLTDSLLLNLGMRYEKPEYDLKVILPAGTTKNKMDKSERAYNLGLVYNFAPSSKLYGRIYRSFRYPSVDEFVSLWTGNFNQNLKQETALGYEIGVQWSPIQQLHAGLRLFRMDIKDEIAYNGTTFQNENLDETRHEGAELDLRYQPVPQFTIYGGIAYLDATFTDGSNDNNHIPMTPEWKSNLGLEWNPGNKLHADIRYTHVDASYMGGDKANNLPKLGNYKTVDLGLGYSCSKNIEIYLKGKNILNEKYSEAAYNYGFGEGLYPMPEATYSAGFRVAF